MREIILIAGLPGSGKSFLGTQIAHREGYAFLDDASRHLDLTRGTAEQLLRYADQPGLVIADPFLCLKNGIVNARAILSMAFPSVPVRLICFENDPTQCRRNVNERADDRVVLDFITALSEVWDPRAVPDCEIRAVYSPTCKA